MQLLRMTSIPMKIKMNLVNARLEMHQPTPLIKLDSQPAKLELQSENIKVRLDTFEARRSMGLKSLFTTLDENAAKGLEAASAATAAYAAIGSQMAKAYEGATIPNIFYNRLFEQPTTQMVFLPKVGPQITWEANQLDIKYLEGGLKSEAAFEPVQSTYTRGNIHFAVEQYNQLEIEYLGD